MLIAQGRIRPAPERGSGSHRRVDGREGCENTNGSECVARSQHRHATLPTDGCCRAWWATSCHTPERSCRLRSSLWVRATDRTRQLRAGIGRAAPRRMQARRKKHAYGPRILLSATRRGDSGGGRVACAADCLGRAPRDSQQLERRARLAADRVSGDAGVWLVHPSYLGARILSSRAGRAARCPTSGSMRLHESWRSGPPATPLSGRFHRFSPAARCWSGWLHRPMELDRSGGGHACGARSLARTVSRRAR